MTSFAEQLAAAIEARRADAVALFDRLEQGSLDTPGVTRASYSERESFAHGLVAEYAKSLGLEIATDAAANTYMTLPGRDRKAPRIITGSHLDSVPHGGNFDGAAGVVAGLVALAALKDLGVTPNCDLTVMAIRAEESVWFQVSYLGSRGALGTLPPGAMDALRIDTKRPAREHIAACGGDPDALERGVAQLSPDSVRSFIELHIEQAPSLVEQGIPVGICTGVPGLFMYPDARIVGEYGHLGTPRRYRRDAAMAGAAFAMALDREWECQEAAGREMALTFGRYHTDMAAHGMTSIAGEFRFSLDIRGYEEDLLARMEALVARSIAGIEADRRVRFELGAKRSAAIGFVSSEMVRALELGAAELRVRTKLMKSPASHDAGAFSAAGIPTGMIFVRNENGSHNPDEAMEIDDFLEATRLLAWWLGREAQSAGKAG
jgi:beta-ureidopropionase / N-carbamoyl-L-amino-acid hydrolase